MSQIFFSHLGPFEVPDFDQELVESLPVVLRDSASRLDKETVNQSFWVAYGVNDQSVSFLRNAPMALPEFCEELVRRVRSKFTNLPDFGVEKVTIMRTGSFGVYWHKDELGRKSAINIGMVKSSEASTRFSGGSTTIEANKDYQELTCENGKAYLIDTGSFHRVVPTVTTGFRYLASISFAEKFAVIDERLKNT